MIIYKYPLDVGEIMEFNWPSSKILLVALDKKTGKSCMWVEHYASPETAQYRDKRKFVVKATGEQFSGLENLMHVASWQNFPFVWHLYEVMR